MIKDFKMRLPYINAITSLLVRGRRRPVDTQGGPHQRRPRKTGTDQSNTAAAKEASSHQGLEEAGVQSSPEPSEEV